MIGFRRAYVSLAFFLPFLSRVISELRRLIAAKFCTILESVFNFLIPVQNFEGTSAEQF